MRAGVDYIGISTSFICHDGRGNFLLHKRSKNCRDNCGFWDFGGGQLEFGSTVEDNVLREVEEEHGCVGKITERLHCFSVFRNWNGEKTHWLAVPFLIKVDPSEAKNNEPDKIDEIGWFRLDNLPQPLHPAVIQELERFADIFQKYI